MMRHRERAWVLLSVVVGDHNVGCVEPVNLMSQKEGSLVISVVCNYEPFWKLSIALALCMHMVVHYLF